jgi:hypothetical protein
MLLPPCFVGPEDRKVNGARVANRSPASRVRRIAPDCVIVRRFFSESPEHFPTPARSLLVIDHFTTARSHAAFFAGVLARTLTATLG